MLKLNDINYSIAGKQILKSINVNFTPGELHMILGPNGSGKTSLLKIASGQSDNFDGEVIYDNHSIKEITTASLSTFRSYLSQQNHIPFPLKVNELIHMGRYPHFEYHASEHDYKIVDQVISKLAISHLQNRNFNTLSGGEQQRVQFARVLAQVWEKTKHPNRYLFLDEPLNNLDIQFQQYFLQTIRELISDDITVIMIVHDINWALSYADKIYLLKEGNIVANGAPLDIITPKIIKEVFNIEAQILNVPERKYPIISFNL